MKWNGLKVQATLPRHRFLIKREKEQVVLRTSPVYTPRIRAYDNITPLVAHDGIDTITMQHPLPGRQSKYILFKHLSPTEELVNTLLTELSEALGSTVHR